MGLLGLGKNNKTTLVSGAVNLVKSITGMIDDSKLTEEERKKYNSKIADSAAKFATDTMNENTERSTARRLIAIVSIYFFYALLVALIVLWKFDPLWFEASKELIISFQLPFAFIAIIGFFFGTHLMRSYKGDKGK